MVIHVMYLVWLRVTCKVQVAISFSVQELISHLGMTTDQWWSCENAKHHTYLCISAH